MNNKLNYLEDFFADTEGEEKYLKLSLKFNPFPRSGTANINGSDSLNQSLIPVNQNAFTKLLDYLKHALTENPLDDADRLVTITITGNYGSGKTQLLLFVKSFLNQVSTKHWKGNNPYVIYVDNPGVNLLEFIGSIISKIGEENFKKYIWNKIIREITRNDNYKSRLAKFQRQMLIMFPNANPDPYSDENTVSYKKFLEAFTRLINTTKERKDFDETFRQVLIEILEIDIRDITIAEYFYELISGDFGVNKTWEALSTGNIKQLNRKEAGIIRYVVKLIKEQGFTDFFILVDEFEDITKGRLTKVQIDNYVYNLRTLLDEHREWSLLFSMTGEALKRLKSISPPLADRITNRLINLQDLNSEEAKDIVINYLNIARDEPSDILTPFDFEGIKQLNNLVEGNARRLLKSCFFMIEKVTESADGALIDSDFVTKCFSQEDNLK